MGYHPCPLLIRNSYIILSISGRFVLRGEIWHPIWTNIHRNSATENSCRRIYLLIVGVDKVSVQFAAKKQSGVDRLPIGFQVVSAPLAPYANRNALGRHQVGQKIAIFLIIGNILTVPLPRRGEFFDYNVMVIPPESDSPSFRSILSSTSTSDVMSMASSWNSLSSCRSNPYTT